MGSSRNKSDPVATRTAVRQTFHRAIVVQGQQIPSVAGAATGALAVNLHGTSAVRTRALGLQAVWVKVDVLLDAVLAPGFVEDHFCILAAAVCVHAFLPLVPLVIDRYQADGFLDQRLLREGLNGLIGVPRRQLIARVNRHLVLAAEAWDVAMRQ